MMEDFIADYIARHQLRFSTLSDAIWDTPETRFAETRSSALLSDALTEEGFRVERGVGGIDTAFIASAGSGKPVIAILGEFDALAGLSQQAAAPGHNLWKPTATDTAAVTTCSARQVLRRPAP